MRGGSRSLAAKPCRDRIQAERNLPPEQARDIARQEIASFDAGELTDDFRVPLDDGTSPTVHEILSSPDRYKGARGVSLDEPTPRRGVTFLWPYPSKANPAIGKPERPWLHSYEHGGRYYRLRASRRTDNHATQDASASEASITSSPTGTLGIAAAAPAFPSMCCRCRCRPG